MKCLQCNKEFEAKRSTKRYCSAVCRVTASRSVTEKVVSVTNSVMVSVTPEPVTVNVPGVHPLGLPLSPTGSKCDSFETLPGDIRDSIDHLGVWCALKGIEDDRRERIGRAIRYQRYVKAG